jgi:hypothetical protein
MEWGPRALGNRLIVWDPRRADMKAILNVKIKRRESFSSFAPSVLEEAVADWLEEDDAVPFMMQVFQIREATDKGFPIPGLAVSGLHMAKNGKNSPDASQDSKNNSVDPTRCSSRRCCSGVIDASGSTAQTVSWLGHLRIY